MIYNLNLLVLIFFSFNSIFYKKMSKNLDKYIFFLLCVFLIVFAGLRYECGFDYFSYEGIFLNNLLETKVEKGYLYLNYIFFKLANYNYFLLIFVGITIYLKFLYIKKNSMEKYTSLLVYYSVYFLGLEFGQIRQGMALSIVLFAIDKIKKDEYMKYLVYILLAMQFHISAILFLPAYFVKKINKKNIYIFFLIGVICSQINLVNIFFKLSNILPDVYRNKILINMPQELNEDLWKIIYDKSLILKILIGTLYLYLYKREKQDDLYLKIYISGIIFSFLFYSIPEISGRASHYYRQVEILLISNIVFVKNLEIKFLVYIFFITYLFYSYFIKLYLYADMFYPYKNYILKGLNLVLE